MPSRNARSIARHSRDQFVRLHPTPSSLRPRTRTHAHTHTQTHTQTHARARMRAHAHSRHTRNKQVRERIVRPTKEISLSTMNKECTICTRHFSQGTHFFFFSLRYRVQKAGSVKETAHRTQSARNLQGDVFFRESDLYAPFSRQCPHVHALDRVTRGPRTFFSVLTKHNAHRNFSVRSFECEKKLNK